MLPGFEGPDLAWELLGHSGHSPLNPGSISHEWLGSAGSLVCLYSLCCKANRCLLEKLVQIISIFSCSHKGICGATKGLDIYLLLRCAAVKVMVAQSLTINTLQNKMILHFISLHHSEQNFSMRLAKSLCISLGLFVFYGQ